VARPPLLDLFKTRVSDCQAADGRVIGRRPGDRLRAAGRAMGSLPSAIAVGGEGREQFNLIRPAVVQRAGQHEFFCHTPAMPTSWQRLDGSSGSRLITASSRLIRHSLKRRQPRAVRAADVRLDRETEARERQLPFGCRAGADSRGSSFEEAS